MPGTRRWVAAVTTTVSGSAAPCTRAATFAVSPNTSPPSAMTTGPVCMPIRHRQPRAVAGAQRSHSPAPSRRGSRVPRESPARGRPRAHRASRSRRADRRPAPWRRGRPSARPRRVRPSGTARRRRASPQRRAAGRAVSSRPGRRRGRSVVGVHRQTTPFQPRQMPAPCLAPVLRAAHRNRRRISRPVRSMPRKLRTRPPAGHRTRRRSGGQRGCRGCRMGSASRVSRPR